MALRDYIIKRILVIIPTLLALSIITFTIMHLAPGGPLDYYIAENPNQGRDPVRIQILTTRLGLDKPILDQYFIWVQDFFTGNLYSFQSGQSITNILLERLSNTAILMSLALIVALIISIPLGVISAVKQYSVIDNSMMLFSLFGASMPSFWLGLMLIFIFSLGLGWFPTSGMQTLGYNYQNVWQAFLDRGSYMVLPIIALSFGRLATFTRLTRSSMLDTLKQDYITTARAKGLKESIVIYKHALKNSLLPLVTVVGISVGYLFAGSAIVETIFAWPGLGKYLVDSIYQRDYPAIMGATMVIALAVVFCTLITDIIYAYLDPRIKY
jgi:peptide/nickel transport system permease protein